ncbi:MAG: hypothetical protein WDO73_11310 [Ignavibacteriota bacterium]
MTGSAVRSKIVDGASPILYGYADNLAIFASTRRYSGFRAWLGAAAVDVAARLGNERGHGGRGTADDPDTPQGRTPVEIPEEPKGEIWEATPPHRRAASQSRERDSAGGAAARSAALLQQ